MRRDLNQAQALSVQRGWSKRRWHRYATSHGGGAVPISSLAGSVETAVQGGLQSGRNFIRVGPWELGIDTRGNVIYHAVYKP